MNMKRFFQLGMLTALLASAAGWAQTNRANEQGEVIDVDADARRITVETDDGINTYSVGYDTEITFRDARGPRTADLDDISEGDNVILDFEEATDGTRNARRIERGETASNTSSGSAMAQNSQNDVNNRSASRQSAGQPGTLPSTASPMYDYALLGMLLLLAAGALRFSRH